MQADRRLRAGAHRDLAAAYLQAVTATERAAERWLATKARLDELTGGRR